MEGGEPLQVPVRDNSVGNNKRIISPRSTAGGFDFEGARLPYQINPVGAKEIKEEVLRNETMFWYLVREFKVYFVGHIPIEVIRGLPKRCKYTIL